MHDAPISWDHGLAASASRAIECGDPYAAIATYRNAIERGASDLATLANYGVLLWRVFEFQQADEVFRQVIEDARIDTATLRRIAHCYFEIGRFGQSAAVMRIALARLDEPDAITANTLAWTLERDHQTEEARQFAEAAYAIDNAYGPAVRLLAHLDRRAGDFERAERRLAEQLRKYPSDFDWGLRYELAAVYDRLGRYDDAFHTLVQAKAQLAPVSAGHLRESYAIRRRQWELTQSVTATDVKNWRAAGPSLDQARRIVFLTGFPRSGTTLLEQIIAANTATVDTDESGILPSQFIEPLVWRAADVFSALIELRSFAAEQLVAGREAFYRMTEQYLGQSIGDRLLIEKNPLLTADLPLPMRLFPEASLLVAHRDPRDVVLSYLFTMVPLNWSSAPAADVVEACRFYADTMRHWLWWRSRLGWPACEIRYERFIADPVVEAQRVAGFLGLEFDPATLHERHRAERRAVRTPTYDDVTKPLYTRAIGRWHNYERHLGPGLTLLQPFLDALGYA